MDKNMFRVSETWRFGESVTCTSRVSGNLLSAGLFKAGRKVRLYCTCPSFSKDFRSALVGRAVHMKFLTVCAGMKQRWV